MSSSNNSEGAEASSPSYEVEIDINFDAIQVETYECSVCFDDVSSLFQWSSTNCNHSLCEECALANARANVTAPQVPCHHAGCRQVVSDEEVLAFLPTDLSQQRADHLAQRLIDASDNVRYCPNPKCSVPVEGDLECATWRCPQNGCHTRFCPHCNKKHRLGQTECSAQTSWWSKQRNNHEELTAEALKNLVTRVCPGEGCGITVVKESGCNHITCRCGAEWCFLCRAPYMDADGFHFETAHNTTLCDGGISVHDWELRLLQSRPELAAELGIDENNITPYYAGDVYWTPPPALHQQPRQRRGLSHEGKKRVAFIVTAPLWGPLLLVASPVIITGICIRKAHKRYKKHRRAIELAAARERAAMATISAPIGVQ